jgi:hypothetical protein
VFASLEKMKSAYVERFAGHSFEQQRHLLVSEGDIAANHGVARDFSLPVGDFWRMDRVSVTCCGLTDMT